MCGITGIMAFNLVGKMNMIHLAAATRALEKRGPDYQDIYHNQFVGLGHRRLSIIDLSDQANQPMWDEEKRYALIYNGEIFNYRELRSQLESEGVAFTTQSDTEVLLRLLIREKEKGLNKLNGFFSFCLYDNQEQSFLLARDRFGVKPLLYLFDDDKFIFASEMKAILQYGIDKTLDYESLYAYLQLNYIPAPDTIFRTVKKLLPGHYMRVRSKELLIEKYYEIPYPSDEPQQLSYEAAQQRCRDLLEAAVQRRLVADVPLGCFLSGGIDSSVITGLAARHKPDLHTFSIGFRDEPFFDETHFAQLVAKHFHTKHTVFSLTNNDLYSHLHDILNYIDEPFADSSAINVFILSKETRKHATVALSGDGADELLGGYNKHEAHWRAIHRGWKENFASTLLPLWQLLPRSRNDFLSNRIRQLERFARAVNLSSSERYWQWASLTEPKAALALLSDTSRQHLEQSRFNERKKSWLATLPAKENLNDIFLTDMKLVLPNDMLMKVDLMSMANSLEVRNPFLDVELVNFIFSLPADFKINGKMRKRLVQDAFRNLLPPELYNRPKKGFEVPLLKWFRREMKSLIMDDLLSEKNIHEQQIFNYAEIAKLKRRLFSKNPGDVHARIWGLVVFQWWFRKYN
ncbi:MAG: asparagine synthase (glutamine-hydrolyzing) [Cyclobacteriaceae bacterium]|nr:asparagine synthase (glutamine-hydrolyzing) [Cyclobacteriaceae bacterium]